MSGLEQGDWYRIHPLFAEYAKLELEAAEPGAAKRIHHDAALWLSPRQPIDAMEHAAAAEEPALVAQLLASTTSPDSNWGRTTLVRWAEPCPTRC